MAGTYRSNAVWRVRIIGGSAHDATQQLHRGQTARDVPTSPAMEWDSVGSFRTDPHRRSLPRQTCSISRSKSSQRTPPTATVRYARCVSQQDLRDNRRIAKYMIRHPRMWWPIHPILRHYKRRHTPPDVFHFAIHEWLTVVSWQLSVDPFLLTTANWQLATSPSPTLQLQLH